MDAWLKTHVALISPIAQALYYAGDNARLAADPEGLRLLITAVKEGLRVLDALAIPITPARVRLLPYLPAWILIPILRRIFATSQAQLIMWRHADLARGEMKLLAAEFQRLARQSGLATPAMDRLARYG